jgi:hypothetical protein
LRARPPGTSDSDQPLLAVTCWQARAIEQSQSPVAVPGLRAEACAAWIVTKDLLPLAISNADAVLMAVALLLMCDPGGEQVAQLADRPRHA